MVGRKSLETLKRLSRVNAAELHQHYVETAVNGTGKWLFEKPSFQDWVKPDLSSILLLHGKGMLSN